MGKPVRRRCAQAIVTWLALTLFALPVLAQQPAAKPPPCVMSRRAVLDDARMNLVWTRHVERLVGWLGEHGFERLDGAKLAAWMSSRIQREDAYGSVVVLPRGISPIALFRGAPSKPLWLQYLRSGGRIVHLGDLPWSYAEASTPEPNELSLEKRQLDLLGMQWTSNGHRSDVVTATDAAREWGIESGDGPATGFPAKQTTTPFHVYTAPSGEVVATDWFRNIRADRPWSGLVKLLQRFDGDDDAALRSVWRAALYCGTPIAVPALPSRRPAPATTGLRVTAAAGGVAGRHELVRGEQLELTIQPAGSLRASEYRVALVERGATRLQQSQASSENKFLLDTAPFADGSYQLQVNALLDGKVVASATDTFGIRYLAPETFNWEIIHSAGSNALRTDQEYEDIRSAGMEVHMVGDDVASLDMAVRHHLGFSLRVMPEVPAVDGLPRAEARLRARLDPHGEPIVIPIAGGMRAPSLAYPAARQLAFDSIKRGVSAVAQLPSFRPYVLTNDDYSAYYGWDYSPHVLARFKASTGSDAPRRLQLPAAPGPIPDDDVWSRWFRWTLENVNGAYNLVETKAATQARRDVRIGPIPGGSQVPLVQLDEPAQYPTQSFGERGFNLIASYYYSAFWQPPLTTTFWMEIGRMSHRDLPEWLMPDALSSAGLTRNSFFHALAGGVSGLVYFRYPERTADAWAELKRLGLLIRRIGGVQAQLHPAHRDIALLTSLTTNSFDRYHALFQTYAYHNLMQAHLSVEMVAEDEVLAITRARSYPVILLHGIKYLRQSTFRALTAFAAAGGTVLADTTVPFELPGAKRVALNLATGAEPGPSAAAAADLADYGRADHVLRVARVMEPHMAPRFRSADSTLVASEFEAAGMPYTWFVNTYDGDEYMLCRRFRSGPPPPDLAALRDWEQQHVVQRTFTTQVTYATLPGIPYDLGRGKELDVVKSEDGAFTITLTMDRLGGALIAWLPGKLTGIALSVPERAQTGEHVRFCAQLQATAQMHGPLPVHFELIDPHGHVALDSGTRVTAKDGAAELVWTPAVNDALGTWTVTATELASGRSTKRTVVLAAAAD